MRNITGLIDNMFHLIFLVAICRAYWLELKAKHMFLSLIFHFVLGSINYHLRTGGPLLIVLFNFSDL